MTQQPPFNRRHFEAEIILLGVRWYVRSALSSRALEELMRERGLPLDHTTTSCWVQRSAPELDQRCRPQLKSPTDSWGVDETASKIRTPWRYLSRAVASQGNSREFLLRARRDAQAAKGFFVKALHATAGSAPQVRPVEAQVAQPTPAADATPTPSAPRVSTVEKNAASPKAEASLKAAGMLPEQVERETWSRTAIT